ncbi:glycoside hydrolase family 15 protein [Oculatella sp. LEGE 06141]|uniref:glycoside hydrolase family 15 protein n=1 Tax=Oculatella sp. LEGE 06141 TaxID=1828648 RepID=UPI001882FCB3|nr:glycoside hydrolase family 15 protein [Oculatella sp. LEGE 06141]MBE9178354.1 glycoside hydrolase family 15 protein [Oculatella sp. LEGE 06141]
MATLIPRLIRDRNANGSSATSPQARLDAYYQEIKTIILARQNPITGLLPASTAITSHGNYTDAWVRDNVYSILAVWGLALAYRKLDDNRGYIYELEHSVVKLMRGLLFAMMRQANKVENFKQTQHLLDALHAKYDLHTADTVVGDDEWGHLQLDATSLYLLMLAQMTASGLQIIFTIDEVNFIQNLVYYIGRAYRTPDYGIWERGNKINHGNPELNASSIGMAKAALEAMNGLDLFGVHGSQASIIHVLPDEIARTRMTLESLLPRESGSKEVDAALLSVIGYPAFAVENKSLIELTRSNVVNKLQGNYGCKRFLRDGHQTVLEDNTRLHYEPFELKQFEHVESEWPLFFTYLLLDGLFRGDRQQIDAYQQRLDALLVERDGIHLLAELYYVPEDCIEAERQNPGSQVRLPNENLPLVWAQSLYLLGQLLYEGFLAVGDIDPLGRHLRMGTHREPLVQIALLAEDELLQAELATYGIAAQTPKQVDPIQVRQVGELSDVYAQIGRNDKLHLSGRPVRRLRSLTTSKIFRICGETAVFLPSFLDPQQFYLTLDYHFLVAQIKGELAYIRDHWSQLGRPTLTLLLMHNMFDGEGVEAIDQSPLLELIKELRDGQCNGVAVKLGQLNQLMLTAGMERVDFIHDFQFTQAPVQDAAPTFNYLAFDASQNWPLSSTQEFMLECETNIPLLLTSLRQSHNLYEQIDLLETLVQLRGLAFDTGLGGASHLVTVADLLNEVYVKASQLRLWAVIRRASGLLNKVDVGLSDAVTDILVRQKQISVGKAYSAASLITSPLSGIELMEKIREFCIRDIRDRPLTQEILIYLGVLIKTDPHLFEGLLTLRVGYLILLITSELARERQVTQDEAYEQLMQLSPFEVKSRLRQVLAEYGELNQTLFQQESIQVKTQQDIQWMGVSDGNGAESVTTDWWRKRQRDGALNWVPADFYPTVWRLMKHCKGIFIGDKLDRRNRLDSHLMLSEMTPGETNFALRVEHLLNKIQAPEYRQVNIEALMELAAIADRNPDLQIEGYIVLDVLIGHAVRLAWLEHHPEHSDRYDEHKSIAWRSFYESSPQACAHSIANAMRFLTELGQESVIWMAIADEEKQAAEPYPLPEG